MSGIYLVRHGETTTPGLFLGRADPPLSEVGRQQARRIAEDLPAPRRLLSSPLRRACETASIMAERWNVDITIDDRLREIGYGEWDGLSWAEIERRWPEQAHAKLKGWWGVRPQGGEKSLSILRRLRGAWRDLQGGPRPVVVVAHVGVNALLAELARTAPKQRFDWESATKVEQRLGQWMEL